MEPHPQLRLITPTASSCVKRRTDERIEVRVAVKSSVEPQGLVVELWAALHDAQGSKEAAYVLKHESTQDGVHVYANEITLPYSGYFPLRVRARTKGSQQWTWSDDSAELWVDPDWVYDAIVYNAFVRYFGAQTVEEDGEVVRIDPGTFRNIADELDKLQEMGINVLYLNPVHQIGELYRNYNPHDLLPEYLQPGCPYSIKDYKSIDSELSYGEHDVLSSDHPFNEFKQLVDAAHERGMRVFLDLVFNHSAHDSVFQRRHPEWYLYKDDVCSLELPYLYPHEIAEGKPWGDPKHTLAPYDHGYWWGDAAQLNWGNILEYPDFIQPHVAPNDPPPNPTLKDMYRYFTNIVNFWIREFGIDGFRCDVAYRVPLDFWKRCIIETRNTAKQAHPSNGSIDGDVVFIAEDYHVAMEDLLKAGFTACYGDYSNKLYSLPDITGYLDYMYNINGQHFPQDSLWFIFPECHDFHRNPTKIAEEFREEHRDADLNANMSRWTMTATLPGIPMIFNGFEKIEWQPASLFSYSTVDWESDKDITEHIQKVNLIRRKEPALQRGSYWYLHTSEGITHGSKVFSFARILHDEVIIVAVNLDVVHQAQHVTIYLPGELPFQKKAYSLTDLLTGERYERSGAELTVSLEPGAAHIFKVSQ